MVRRLLQQRAGGICHRPLCFGISVVFDFRSVFQLEDVYNQRIRNGILTRYDHTALLLQSLEQTMALTDEEAAALMGG